VNTPDPKEMRDDTPEPDWTNEYEEWLQDLDERLNDEDPRFQQH